MLFNCYPFLDNVSVISIVSFESLVEQHQGSLLRSLLDSLDPLLGLQTILGMSLKSPQSGACPMEILELSQSLLDLNELPIDTQMVTQALDSLLLQREFIITEHALDQIPNLEFIKPESKARLLLLKGSLCR